ncbi:Lrp4 [Symbiodinium pilosum]|uniref:Lrp4 protein n=1 Tax=Symbiodinium pilosum TaxID=2952 RepID=A0A812RUY2_SYMPI|nr:Lrp4 [Symbiodinium pilosum]
MKAAKILVAALPVLGSTQDLGDSLRNLLQVPEPAEFPGHAAGSGAADLTHSAVKVEDAAKVAPVEQVLPVETKRTYPPQNFLRRSSEHQQAVLMPGLSLASFWQTGGPNVSVDAAPAAPPAAATAPAKPAAAHGIDFTRSTSPDLAEVSVSDPFRAMEAEDLREAQRLKALDQRLRQRASQPEPVRLPQHRFQGADADASTWADLEEEDATIESALVGLDDPRRLCESREGAECAAGDDAPLVFSVQLLCLWLCRHVAGVDVVTGLSLPRGLALDLQDRRVYWTEDGTRKLRSATLEGQDLRDVVVKASVQEAPRDVAVDAVRRKVYWTALCCGLRRADLNGDNEEVVASAEFASGVIVHEDAVYWADWMNGRILRRALPGDEEVLVTGLASPVDLALDPSRRMIYWSDVGHARTQRAPLDGHSGAQVLNMSWAIMNTWGMAIDASHRKLYMTDFEKTGDLTGSPSDYAGRIIRTNLDGSGAEVLVNEPGMSTPVPYVQPNWMALRSGKLGGRTP